MLAANLTVRARSRNLILNDVKQARENDRSIVLTWAMRGTMHLVAADDLGWLLPLFGPLFIHKSQRRYTQLGLDEQTRLRAAQLMRKVLGNRGPLTRSELAGALASEGIPVEGQAIAHLVRYAALDGIICFGPEREGKLTYVVLDDWLPQKAQAHLDPTQAQAELAHRYLEAYGPATPQDFASWSGFSLKQARAGISAISDDLLEVRIADSSAWMLKHNAAWLDDSFDDPVVRLLPRYDTYLLGYRSRDFMVSEGHAKRIHPGGGIIKQTLIVNGRAVGTWRRERKKSGYTIFIEPFDSISQPLLPALETEVRDIGRFLQQETALQIENPQH